MKLGGIIVNKYRCIICGYTYDPKRGDKTQRIEEKTPFEELPESWRCPTCRAQKMDFKEVK